MKKKISEIETLIATIQKLRGPQGCPWDKKQTTESLKKYLHEEFSEIIEAIEKQDPDNLCEELGDFLYLIIMVSEINREQHHFSFNDVIQIVNRKLIRRHPHVFEGKSVKNEDELRIQWEEIKKSEKN
ncbi:MAG: nucleotide pyrophosphohydrolase [Desulfobulbaceae bacterium]|nr:MAG: nucleotide pyrophosphohydrolase [Desulfobulbaceae bacterium]